MLYLQVKGGKFVRAFPDKGFSCNTADTAHVSGDFGKVPVEKSRVGGAQFLQYTILGLAAAGVYAVAASGLVVTYTTSGIFNFAHGAIGDDRGVHLLGAADQAPAWPAPAGARRWCCSCWRR